MQELAAVLGRERLLLERLLFRVVELETMLAAGHARFLPWAADEVDTAVQAVRAAELRRALLVNQLAEDSGVDDSAMSLRTLCSAAQEPYATIFSEQREALRLLIGELSVSLKSCSELAGDGVSLVREVLDRVAIENGGTEWTSQESAVAPLRLSGRTS